MLYINGDLVEATEQELLQIYFDNHMDNVMDFDQYMMGVEQHGCSIICNLDDCATCRID